MNEMVRKASAERRDEQRRERRRMNRLVAKVGAVVLPLIAGLSLGTGVPGRLFPEESRVVAGVPGQIEKKFVREDGCVINLSHSQLCRPVEEHVFTMEQCPADAHQVQSGAGRWSFNPEIGRYAVGCVVGDIRVSVDDFYNFNEGNSYVPVGMVGEPLLK